jgi:uncharacterized membrane protein
VIKVDENQDNAAEKQGSGLAPNLAGALAYFLGPITGILFLLIEKNNKFVRFHAMQSTITFGGLFVVQLVLGVIPILGWMVGSLLSVAALIAWLFLMYKAFNNEEYELPVIGDIARKQLDRSRS